jgi:AAA domain
MGILLAGACPFPTSCAPVKKPKQASSITPGASLKAARSSKSGAAATSTATTAAAAAAAAAAPHEARVLVCAPSNAAADELTLRLLHQGVIGADGSDYRKYDTAMSLLYLVLLLVCCDQAAVLAMFHIAHGKSGHVELLYCCCCCYSVNSGAASISNTAARRTLQCHYMYI